MKKTLMIMLLSLGALFSCHEVLPPELPLLLQEVSTYNTSNSPMHSNQIQAVAIESPSVFWMAVNNELIRVDKTDGAWRTYVSSNTPLPSGEIRVISIDAQKRVWIGTDNGLAMLDENTWSVYNTSNSELPSDAITQIVPHPSQDLVWVGTENGLFKLEGDIETFYDDSNSGLMDGVIRSMTLDADGRLWVGTFDHMNNQGRVYQFYNDQWKVKKLETLQLTSSFPNSISTDGNDNVWIAISGTSASALVRVKDNEWVIYDQSNSSLPRAGIFKAASKGSSISLIGLFGIGSFNPSSVNDFRTRLIRVPNLITYDNEGKIWVADNDGLHVYIDQRQ